MEEIIKMLAVIDHYGTQSELIYIAKGKYELPTSFGTLKKQVIRWLKR
jgi:hypothetical protein